MDQDIRREFPYEVRVKLKGFRKYKGFSDVETTFCCSATPCYFVVFPALGYKGYFQRNDVETKSREI